MEKIGKKLGLTPLEAITSAWGNKTIKVVGELGVITPGYRADVIIVDGRPDNDVRILQDRSKLRSVISRGRQVDLQRPWPTRRRLPGEKVSNWAQGILTYDVAMGDVAMEA